ncbi:hypothetical protein [Ornithinibacillus sp. JPR2-1]|uniref:hypothetical protein n=1 Tax=Ornithinibacillus TaxID=484508 RepID=UPI0031D4BA08
MQQLTIMILLLTVLVYGVTLIIYRKAYAKAKQQIKDLERANRNYYMEQRRQSSEYLH